MSALPLRFSEAQAHQACEEWGFNCGPAAIAAVLGLSIAEVRPHLGDFEAKRYTNPTLMRRILGILGAHVLYFSSIRMEQRGRVCEWPIYGLVRVQWEGPWTAPGVPIRARYRHSHWVGVHKGMVFDVNCLHVGGWVNYATWEERVVPWILEQCEPRANGAWHFINVVALGDRKHESQS